jgi:hypothetical protein
MKKATIVTVLATALTLIALGAAQAARPSQAQTTELALISQLQSRVQELEQKVDHLKGEVDHLRVMMP